VALFYSLAILRSCHHEWLKAEQTIFVNNIHFTYSVFLLSPCPF